jgi:hypothetical protein
MSPDAHLAPIPALPNGYPAAPPDPFRALNI